MRVRECIGVSFFLPVLLVGIQIWTGSGATGRKRPAPDSDSLEGGDFRKKLGKLSRSKKADGFCSCGVSPPDNMVRWSHSTPLRAGAGRRYSSSHGSASRELS